MLSAGMYVRCPADKENMAEPRVFICGQITKVDEFKKTVVIKIHDPFDYLLFFEDLPKGTIELPQGNVDRCNFFMESHSSTTVSNAVPGLSPGLSHQTCRTACAPFTPSTATARNSSGVRNE